MRTDRGFGDMRPDGVDLPGAEEAASTVRGASQGLPVNLGGPPDTGVTEAGGGAEPPKTWNEVKNG